MSVKSLGLERLGCHSVFSSGIALDEISRATDNSGRDAVLLSASRKGITFNFRRSSVSFLLLIADDRDTRVPRVVEALLSVIVIVIDFICA